MAFKFTTIASNATYNLSRSVASVDEGSQVTITLATTGVQRGQAIPYTITGGGVTSADFVGSPSLTGNITINNNQLGAVILTANADVTTEGEETLVFTLNDTQQAVAVAINDTSVTAAPSYPQTYFGVVADPDPYTSSGDDFGDAIAISGNLALVGAMREDTVDQNGSGKAYLINITSGAIVHQFNNPDDAEAPNATVGKDNFGSDVALTPTRAIIAAMNDTSDTVSFRGKVYVFDTSSYNLLYTLAGSADNDYFGSAVATAGGKLVVGAMGAASNAGQVYVYDLASGSLLATIDNPNAPGSIFGDMFGQTVAISGDVIVVGAPGADGTNSNMSAGCVYTYSVAALTATGNTPTRTIPNPTGGEGWTTSGNTVPENFGWAVTTNGTKVVIGSPGTYGTNTFSAMPGMGRVYIYNATGNAAPIEIASPTTTPIELFVITNGDGFGWDVDASGDYVMVGAMSATNSSGVYSTGRVDTFNINTGALLNSIANPNAAGTPEYDAFGCAVAMSGNVAVVGAYGENDQGAVYTFI